MFIKKIFFSTLLILLCTSTFAQKKFSLIPSIQSGVTFRNDIYEDEKMFYYLYEYLYLGGGVSVGDINNDGLTDIYLSSTIGKNKLFLNQGNFTFKDITVTAGVDGGLGIKMGVNMVDINGDGWLDIVVCKSGYKDEALRTKMVYINNGNLTFTNKATELGLNDASYSIQSYFFDFDNDGDKDVFFINHDIDFNKSMNITVKQLNGKLVYVEDTTTQYVSNRLYENRSGKFFDITNKANLISHAFGLSASLSDFNNDGYTDIFVANDFNKPDYLYINNKNGTFTNKMKDYLPHNSFSSMGTDCADINNDGLLDLFAVDMAVEDPKRQKQLFALNQNYDKFQIMLNFNLYYQYPHNMLYLNNGNGAYSEMAYHSGIAETEWSWAPLIADYDNDGNKDLYITNGLKRDITDWDYKAFVLDSILNVMNKGGSVNLASWMGNIPQVKTKNYLYRNNGTLKFENATNSWMDAPPTFSSGGAYADFDNDGDLDLVVNNVDDEAHLYKNNSEQNIISNFLRFNFYKSKTNKQEVYGVRVKLFDDNNNIQLQEYNPQRGFMSTVEHALHFGLGVNKQIKKVEISFLNGKQIVLNNINSNQTLTIYENDAKDLPKSFSQPYPIFSSVSNTTLNFTHKENDFIDFKREPLIPYKCSRKGPYYAMADVNGDKLDDIFIGGSSSTSGKLFLQLTNGSFKETPQPSFEKDKLYEDNGAVFFDADNDGDNDLYVVSGGAQFDKGSSQYQDRLYTNNGKGVFTKTTNSLPVETNNGSYVISLDFDSDGDLDLFVGGGVMPGKFPKADECMLLQNNKGVFTNVTIAKELVNIGIVNDATWADVDSDKKNELIITGEWMSTCIFKLIDGKFVQQNPDLNIKLTKNNIVLKDTAVQFNTLKGWFNKITCTDVDGDGDMDILAGNRGTNSKIQCNFAEPTTIYAKDFDGNGSYDALLGYYIWGKCYPMYSRDQLIDQMPMFRKKFIRYRMYSGKTMDDIFTPEQKQGMDIYTANCFESGIFINDGNNHFTFSAFPELAQLSTINDFVVDDFDKDGINDALFCGNSNDADVGTGNYDATSIALLKGLGKAKFSFVPYNTTGLNQKGEVRKMIYLKDKKQIVLLKNNAEASVIKLN